MLARRLASLTFDAPGSPHGFRERLATDNRWARGYADRVVEEYRRFLWLAATAKHVVSPSDPVDQAWHLHLQDTRSYWDHLCGQILGRPLHHEPAGDAADRERFADAYRRTLRSYRDVFGEPPADIWPPPGQVRRAQFRRIDASEVVMVPRRALRAGAIAIAVATAAAGVNLIPWWGVLAIGGAQFLGLSAFICAASAVVGISLRGWARRQSPARPKAPTPDPYQVGYLTGSAAGAVDVAIVELVSTGLVQVDARAGGLVPGRTNGEVQSPMRQLVLERVHLRPGAPLRELRPSDALVRELVEVPLDEAGLVVKPARRHIAPAVPLAGLAGLVLLDVAKLAVSIREGGPAALLLPFLAIVVLAAIGFGLDPLWLSLVVKFVPFTTICGAALPVRTLWATLPVSTLPRISMPWPLLVPGLVSENVFPSTVTRRTWFDTAPSDVASWLSAGASENASRPSWLPARFEWRTTLFRIRRSNAP